MPAQRMSITAALAAATLICSTALQAQDWPQWRGPKGDGKSAETGFMREWPDGGPRLVWKITSLGEGYGSVAVKKDAIYVQGTRPGTDADGKAQNRSVLFSLNRSDGQPRWTADLGPALEHGMGNGPRSTATVEDERVFALTENGDLACLKPEDGSVIWRKNILKEYEGTNPEWRVSESPLVVGDHLYVSPGGRKAGIVAMHKKSGRTLWTCEDLSDQAGYSSNILEDVGGVPTLMNFTHDRCVGVRATDGKLMWTYDKAANKTANCSNAVYADNKVFFSSAYDTGGALLDLTVKDGLVEAKEAYFTKKMDNHHGGMVLVDGYLYGFSNAALVCMEFETGREMWKDRSVGKGSLVYADGLLFLLSETNEAGLAEATPKGYVEKGRFRIDDTGRQSWAHPVVCGGRLYIRNQGQLMCYDVAAKVDPAKVDPL